MTIGPTRIRMAWLAILAAMGGAAQGGAPAGPAPPAPADDLAALVAEVKPPARFADYTPDFRIRSVPHTYWWWGPAPERSLKPFETTLEIILDGDRPVGILPNYFFAPFPGADTRAWISETFNPQFRRFGVDIPNGSPGAKGKSRHEVVGTGKELVFVVRHGAWAEDPPAEQGDAALTRFTLRVAPVLGYVIQRDTQWRTRERPADRDSKPLDHFHAGMWYSGGITSIWPDEITYRYSGSAEVRTDAGRGPRFTIWSDNSESLFRKYHSTVRPGGFVANLKDRWGWGVALTNETGAAIQVNKCPIWGGFHPQHPLDAVQGKDGQWTGRTRQRLVTLPPEIVDRVIADARQVNAAGRVILVRVGGEDFEDQPLPAGTVERGFQPAETHGLDTGQACRITDRHAHSGKRSLEVDGVAAEAFAKMRFWPRDRGHSRFLPNRPYRLECWVQVEGKDTEAFLIPTPAMGLAPERLAAGDGVGEARTRSVREGEGWQKVTLDFSGHAHGNPINVRFVVLGPGKAYFDDFSLRLRSD